MVDVEADFNISVEGIKKAISPKTKVIIPVDLAGYPCDYKEINDLVSSEQFVNKFNPKTPEQEKLGRILVLSDSAHSLGAYYNVMRTGSLTDISVFSFHAVKNLTTAEGGAVCLNLPGPFNNEELYKELTVLSLHGQSKDALSKQQKGNWRYDVVTAGYKYNMTDIQAAMGLVELERYDKDMLARRKEIFDLYTDQFSQYGWAQTPEYRTGLKTSSYHVFIVK